MRSSLDGASFRRRAGAGSEFRRGRDGPAAGRWERYSLDASGRACGDGDDGVRRLSLDSDGGFSAHSDTAQNTWCDTPGGRNVNTDAIIRQEYHRRIATQIWLSNLAPIFHYLGGSYHVLVTRGALWNWTPLQLQKLLCGCLSAGLLALCTLKKASALLPLRWQSTSESVMRHLLRVEVLTYFVINAAGFYEFHALADENCPRSTAAACGQRYFLTFHTAILPKWIISQITGRFIFFPEIVRNASFAAGTLLLAYRDASLSPALTALVLCEALFCFVYGMLCIKLCRALVFEDRHLPKVETCPRALAPAREFIIGRLEVAVRWLLDEPALDFNAVAGIATGCVLVCRLYGDASLFGVSASINITFLSLILTSLVSKLLGGTTQGLRLMVRRLGLGTEERALFDLRARLASMPSESSILRAASSALQELLPGATATAVATFQPDAGSGGVKCGGLTHRLAGLEAGADSASSRAALEAALTVGNGRGTSVAFVCREAAARGMAMAWSGDFPSATEAFADWRAASRCGLTGEVVTAPLAAGPALVGFMTAHFTQSATGKHAGERRVNSESLREYCEIVGAAIFCRRAQNALETSQSIVHDIFPQHVAKALEARAREEAAPAEAPSAEEVAGSSSPGMSHSPARSGSGQGSDGSAVLEAATDARGGDHHLAPVQLRTSSQLFAEAFSSVTVIFADIVGFTALARERAPSAVMATLDDLFSRFDDLCTRHDVFKIETIGDSYMAASGMLPRRIDHASVAVRFSLDLLAAAKEVDLGEGKGHVMLRVGMHAGPVTAGLIGRTRARYCLFGDAVNTASRMESLGRPGAVHMTAETAALCDFSPSLCEHQRVDVKGKGVMHTCLLAADGPEASEVLRQMTAGKSKKTPAELS